MYTVGERVTVVIMKIEVKNLIGKTFQNALVVTQLPRDFVLGC